MRYQTPVSIFALIAAIAAPAQGQELSDAQIAHIAVTANALDVEAAKQALEHASDDAVRGFAETMIRDHEAVIEQAVALAGRLGVTPAENETSASLTHSAEEVREHLSTLMGSDFDRAYMENEVAYHGIVIGAVRDVLVPNTSNDELRGLLEAVIPALEAHLAHAETVLDGLDDS